VTYSVKPTVGNVEGDENSARAKNSKTFGKELILEFHGFDVVQDENGKDRRKGLIGKRQP
jgi:hypothetical protein